MNTSIKEQFRTYLSNCVQTRRQTGKSFIIGRTAVDSYVSFVEADKLFDYNPDEWRDIDSIFDITSSEKILQIIQKLFSDERFKAKDSGESSQYYRSNAIKQYYCFLKARELFINTDNYSISKEFEYERIPLQQIFYGAPGTGKSHTINEITEQQPKENVFRTTFHPDSDYSTFVGCYKPTKEKTNTQSLSILDYDSLVNKFKEYLDVKNPYQNITRACTLFGYDYHDSIVRMQDGNTHTIPELVTDAYKSGTTYDSQVRAGMACFEEAVKPQISSSKITYSFVPQSFTKAYLRAWQTTEPVYLVIEEINRGNCAQIFGDLFQLLDRKCDGFAEYPIKADNDLAAYIAEKLSASSRADIPELVRSGEELMLPSNLYIWATMNTSDQSLFPIDSAFKRRWEWKYIPIDTKKESWVINVDGTNYDWSDFLEKINAKIESATSSEDKMLGFYFCKAENNIISAGRFVSKVLFYLWNDVFKDYGFDDAIFNDENNQKLSFRNFYKLDGTVDENKVKRFLDNLEVKSENDGPNGEDESSENAPGVTEKQLRFWQGFNNARKNNQEYCQIYSEKTPLGQVSMDLSFGTSAYHPFMGVLFNKSLIRAGIWIQGTDRSTAIFEHFKENEAAINAIAEVNMDFVTPTNPKNPDNMSYSVRTEKHINVNDEATWKEAYSWMMDMAIKMKLIKDKYGK